MDYEILMRKCFKLAKKGKTSPNPMVGCVVLDENNNLISEGYHRKYGENHAERDALLKLKNNEEKNGTLIVNLEPCNHYGKTPPCSDLIIERGIKRVVISNVDPNPVASGGIQKLKASGIEVITGVLEEDGKKLNEVFFTNIAKQRPFIVVKTASTIDGKIATKTGDSKWITSDEARLYARKLRQKYDCILTSSSTVIADNPQMQHKCKVIIDRDLKTDLNSQIYQKGDCYIVSKKEFFHDSIKWIPYTNLEGLMKELYNRKIMSVFVEAGGTLCGSFLKEGLVDKIYYFIAPKILNDNLGKSCFDGAILNKISQAKEFKFEQIKHLGVDLMLELVVKPF